MENYQDQWDFTKTQNHTYKISAALRNVLSEWFISLEGCVALILVKLAMNDSLEDEEWGLINSETGGLYIKPYTIMFYENHIKVIDPVSSDNLAQREEIERLAAVSVRGIMDRMQEAQEGYAGLAMLSYAEEKTGLSRREIVRLINKKARRIVNPRKSPIIKPHS